MRDIKLGLIGNPLGHSWSPEIHNFFIGADYQLWQLDEGELDDFFARRDFDGINVTIPYKEKVISYLDEIDVDAAGMKAVNCIVNSGGRLIGYNTDAPGLRRMMERNSISCTDGKAAVLGSGGASKAAIAACTAAGWDYYVVSRTARDGCIDYTELYERQGEIRLIINATPVGMYPDVDAVPIDLEKFTSLEGVVDIIANPLRTRLVYEASARGINACGGLEMLVAQAAKADELFTECSIDDERITECVMKLAAGRRNIVLTGMPSSGKTTLGRMLADRTGREFVDTDDEIVRRIGMPIADYFAMHGEESFRRIEADVIRDMIGKSGCIISTGGGVVKNRSNMIRLAHNSLIVWIDRSPELLQPTDSRPLSSKSEDIYRLYEERHELYDMYSDIRINNDGAIEDALAALEQACML